MINLKGELETSIPSKCENYYPLISMPTEVKCSKLGVIYTCFNFKGEISGCYFVKTKSLKNENKN